MGWTKGTIVGVESPLQLLSLVYKEKMTCRVLKLRFSVSNAALFFLLSNKRLPDTIFDNIYKEFDTVRNAPTSVLTTFEIIALILYSFAPC